MDESIYPIAEAAARLGMTVDALRKRIKRGHLEAVKGNDGLVRVRLTSADLSSLSRRSAQPTSEQSPDNGQPDGGQAPEYDRTLSGHLSRQSREISILKAEVERQQEAIDRAQERLQRAEDELRQAHTATEALRVKLERESEARETARLAAAVAEGEVKGLREALAEARKPFWRKWIG